MHLVGFDAASLSRHIVMPRSALRPATPAPISAGGGGIAPSSAMTFPVVGIGASAGGLEACSSLLEALGAQTELAFILVQHLDPTHESLMPELLAAHTSMTVQQAVEGMSVEAGNLYIIPPGTSLAVEGGQLRLSNPKARHGARLPFDHLLKSLALEYGRRAVCIVLSGTGGDGSQGLIDIKSHGGWVIAQDPGEAGFDGMPLSAVATGQVDQVLTLGEMPKALLARIGGSGRARPKVQGQKVDHLPIVDLLREKTTHDFGPYKAGTLRRRIERRMSLHRLGPPETDKYLEILKADAGEVDLLAKDLLIHVTSFFRDKPVFDLLASTILPDLARQAAPDQSLRVWVAGCSTGEEAYSLAMLLREAISDQDLSLKLQIFASDVDPDAISAAREGVYPTTIADDVPAALLARYFSRDEHGYRVIPELRSSVIFTVQDLLSDPPFSRLDLISCRNVLIYLEPEAQGRILDLFHFALKPGGVLLLGGAETAGEPGAQFDMVAKAQRIYRKAGRMDRGKHVLQTKEKISLSSSVVAGRLSQGGQRQSALAELCRRMVNETYAPPTVLTNDKLEWLYAMGPVDHYLKLASGHVTLDVLAMAPPALRAKLREATNAAKAQGGRVAVAGGMARRDGQVSHFSVECQLVTKDGEDFFVISFVEATAQAPHRAEPATLESPGRIAELEQALTLAQGDLKSAILTLEASNEEQRAVYEEALSINEEYQSTNEELVTSKEELQSLNEELTALNSQLQETLERQRTTSDDLQSVLYSTDVATLFLDTKLRIRFFTPATTNFFNVIAGDVGRPLADLRSLAPDGALDADARTVLKGLAPIDREIERQSGEWFVRRILPYRAHDNDVEGVVITYIDITERKNTAKDLEAAKHQAETANIAKSRFLAAASHDLRQPLQAMALLQGLLSKISQGERARHLIERLDETLGSMTGMLDTLLDINQIDAGTVQAERVTFPISELMERLHNEFSYGAQSLGIDFRYVGYRAAVISDPGLLEQMIRNFLSNALKYTRAGRILLGCRRRGDFLSIEVWDTGIGIPAEELEAIFEEYHQLDNAARERVRGLGLGLSIVQRLGRFLGHPVKVRSQLGKGSAFSVEVDLDPAADSKALAGIVAQTKYVRRRIKSGQILLIEDEPEVRDLLTQFLEVEGYQVAAAGHGPDAIALVRSAALRPDLILADFNLPGGMTGLEAAIAIQGELGRNPPIVILTGDISTGAIRAMADQDCLLLNKPVKLPELSDVLSRLLPEALALSAPAQADSVESEFVYIIDDDPLIARAMGDVLQANGRPVRAYHDAESFLKAYHPGLRGSLIVDAYLPGMSGLELLARLQQLGSRIPAIMVTGHGEVGLAVQAMKAGAADFLEKPVRYEELLSSLSRVSEAHRTEGAAAARQEDALSRLSGLTSRQTQIMEMVLRGDPSKNIAADLNISQRTVENHRAAIMKRTGAKSLPALARLAVSAGAADEV